MRIPVIPRRPELEGQELESWCQQNNYHEIFVFLYNHLDEILCIKRMRDPQYINGLEGYCRQCTNGVCIKASLKNKSLVNRLT